MKKNILRGWIPTTGLVLAMALSTFAKDGMLVSDFTGNNTNAPCSTKVDSGILIGGFGGMLVSDLFGMLVSDLIGTTRTCGEKVDSGILIGG